MKYKALLYITVCVCFMTCLLMFPGGAANGVKRGLELSATVVIPSLFPFTVLSLILHNTISGLKSSNFAVFLLSHIGGYPVGAKLIDNSYKNGSISKKTAEIMLAYCVNSGPAFIVLGIGAGIWNNKLLGYLLLFSSLLSSFTLYFSLKRFTEKTSKIKDINSSNTSFGELFVDSTYEATETMFKICGTVVVFSTLIELIKRFEIGDVPLSLLEITNGVAIIGKNVYITAFLLGFGGFSVHFQIYSICNRLKPNYIRFLIYRTINGLLTSGIFSLLVKTLRISTQVLSDNYEVSIELTKYSIVFSVMLLICGILFMLSVNKSEKLE